MRFVYRESRLPKNAGPGGNNPATQGFQGKGVMMAASQLMAASRRASATCRWGLAAVILFGGGVLSACSSHREEPVSASPVSEFASAVRVIEFPTPVECVPYARRYSKIDLRGDAWTWWDAAKGNYDRGNFPEPGAVLVLKRQGNSRGHLAVVRKIVSDRIILANHANWLNQGRVFENTPILDVSERGDWSAVRVWYPPGKTWGRRVYRAYGFIYGKRQRVRSN